MAQRILSIDLQTDLLTAVLLDEDKSREIIASAAIIIDNKSAEEIVTELTSTLDCTDSRCLLSLGSSFFSFQNLTLPFSDKKSIAKILPLELEDNIVGSTTDMIIDSMTNSREDGETDVISAMINRNILADYFTPLTHAGIFPELITLSGLPTIFEILKNGHPPEEFIFLDLRLDNASLFLFSSKKLQLVRPLTFRPFPFNSEHTTALSKDEATGQLTVHGLSHSAESFRELALTVKQTLTSISLQTPVKEIPIYVDGTAPFAQSASTWLDAAFDNPCMICGRAGLLPLPTGLSEATEAHASFLTACLSLGLQDKNAKNGFNFSKNEFSAKNEFSSYIKIAKTIAFPLLAILILFPGYLIYNTHGLKQKQNALIADIHAVFKETLPDTTRIVDPIQQLQVAVKEAKFSSTDGGAITLPYTVLDILHELSTRIPNSIDVRLTRMIYETSGLRLTGTTDTFNTVDNMKKDLEQSPFFTSVTISSANMNPKDKNVRFELKIAPGEIVQ